MGGIVEKNTSVVAPSKLSSPLFWSALLSTSSAVPRLLPISGEHSVAKRCNGIVQLMVLYGIRCGRWLWPPRVKSASSVPSMYSRWGGVRVRRTSPWDSEEEVFDEVYQGSAKLFAVSGHRPPPKDGGWGARSRSSNHGMLLLASSP